MSSQQQQQPPNPPPNFGSEQWATDPFNLAPTNPAQRSNDVGTGQRSSYREQTYTLPGGTTYISSSGF